MGWLGHSCRYLSLWVQRWVTQKWGSRIVTITRLSVKRRSIWHGSHHLELLGRWHARLGHPWVLVRLLVVRLNLHLALAVEVFLWRLHAKCEHVCQYAFLSTARRWVLWSLIYSSLSAAQRKIIQRFARLRLQTLHRGWLFDLFRLGRRREICNETSRTFLHLKCSQRIRAKSWVLSCIVTL